MIICSDPPVENHCACTSEPPTFVCTSASILTRTPATTNASEPVHLFLNPISEPLTLSARYFSAALYQSIYLCIFNKTLASITNKDDRCNISTNKCNRIRQVNAQQIDNLKIIYTLSKAAGLKGNNLMLTTTEAHHPTTFRFIEHYAWGPSRQPPTHPRTATWPPSI